MVSLVKLTFRLLHLFGAFLLFAASAIVLIIPPAAAHDFLRLPLGFALPGLTLNSEGVAISTANQPLFTVSRMSFWIEIIGGVLVLSGVVNAVLLAPKRNMEYVPKRLSSWRRMIYGMKLVLFSLVTPMSNKLVEALYFSRLFNASSSLPPGALSAEAEGEILRTAAIIKLVALCIGVMVGSYARYYREDATMASAEVHAHISTPSGNKARK